jgi:23S rRNA (cytidine1920-2'-O)/16S rRNA (cytidine1409-2'-O)-methyltransferase
MARAADMKQRLDQALVARGFFESRARAQAAIAAGLVSVGGAAARKPSDMIAPDAAIAAEAPHPYVSRGGVKLAHALDVFRIDPAARFCLDVGASTGGFTDVLLRRGARHVAAVDTGRDQLHARLRGDPRIALFEGQDIRAFDSSRMAEKASLVVVDASFISLTLIAPALAPLATPDADLVALVKPQFEVGRASVGKGGLVADEAATQAALKRVRDVFVAQGWSIGETIDSPITGGDGNREYLLRARRGAP